MQREIEVTNKPNIFSNSIIYCFSSSLYQSMACSMYTSTDHIKFNQGGGRGVPYIPNDKCRCNCPVFTARKIFDKWQMILASDHNILNLEIRKSG